MCRSFPSKNELKPAGGSASWRAWPVLTAALLLHLPPLACAQEAGPSGLSENEAFALKIRPLRDQFISAIPPLEPPVPGSTPVTRAMSYRWKRNIVTDVFWVGQPGSTSSSWDPQWQKHYGGVDTPDPKQRENFVPKAFSPGLNPFYVALPFNDLEKGTLKPEVRSVIPWYKQAFVDEKTSICRNRWVAIRNPANNRVCYAQWSDSGPGRSDHWQYVFGNENPKPSGKLNTGISISPAVRDYLDQGPASTNDWRFVERSAVPQGPWCAYGKNNPFVQELLNAAPEN